MNYALGWQCQRSYELHPQTCLCADQWEMTSGLLYPEVHLATQLPSHIVVTKVLLTLIILNTLVNHRLPTVKGQDVIVSQPHACLCIPVYSQPAGASHTLACAYLSTVSQQEPATCLCVSVYSQPAGASHMLVCICLQSASRSQPHACLCVPVYSQPAGVSHTLACTYLSTVSQQESATCLLVRTCLQSASRGQPHACLCIPVYSQPAGARHMLACVYLSASLLAECSCIFNFDRENLDRG